MIIARKCYNKKEEPQIQHCKTFIAEILGPLKRKIKIFSLCELHNYKEKQSLLLFAIMLPKQFFTSAKYETQLLK